MIDDTCDVWERFIELCMVVLLAFMPLCFGVVHAWSEQIVFGLVAVISIATLIRLTIMPRRGLYGSWIYLALILMLLFVALQLFRFPADLLQGLSPHTVDVKQRYLADLPHADTLLSRMSLSFYPQGTVHDLRLVWTVAVIVFAVLNIYRKPVLIKHLLTIIALIGGGMALLAIAQIVTRTDKIYWIIPSTHPLADAGPFVNHSHFSQFMNLSVGAALARILVELHERFFQRKDTSVPEVMDYLRSSRAFYLWLLVAIVILGMISIFLSMSRGGMISILIAGSFTTLIMTLQKGSKCRGQLMVIMALVAFICVLYIGFDAVYDRLASLGDIDQAEGGRWQIIQDIASAWKRFPVFGTGLGTHKVVYPMFDRSTIPALAAYADNEYAQTLEETGLIGFTLLVIIILCIWIAYFKTIFHISHPIQTASYGLGYGLLAIMIHSFSDFGQHLPANAILTAIFGSLLIILARPSNFQVVDRMNLNTISLKPKHLSMGTSSLLIFGGIWIWVLLGANSARIAEAHWRAVMKIEQTLMKNDWQGTDKQYVDLLTHAGTAVEAQPHDIHYNHWLNVYRWRAISRNIDPNTKGIILLPETLEYTRQIISELYKARVLCPTFGQTLCVIGELEQTVFADPNGIDHIRQGYELAPCDPVTCYTAGMVDAEQGDKEAAQAKFARAIQLDSNLYEDIALFCIYSIKDPKMALTLSQNNIGRLNLLATILAEIPQESDLLNEIRTQIIKKLEQKCTEEDVSSANTFASLARLQSRNGDIDAAIANYKEALIRNYSNIYWHLELAKLLGQQGQFQMAIHQAKICLRLQRDFDPAKRLIMDLSVKPEAMATTVGE